MAHRDPISVLLLKTKSSPTDGYEEYFSTTTLEANGRSYTYEPSFIPVLEHKYNDENLTQVRDLFTSGDICRKYAGLIFTSQRAVEGFARMLQEEVDASTTSQLSSQLTLYTVGPATAKSLAAIRDSHLPHSDIIGEDAGTGANLARVIQQHHHRTIEPADPRGLLFLTGEKHRDDIPKILMNPHLPPQLRIPVTELVVYETGVMDSFPGDFEGVVREASARSKVVWVVVFSPAGCEPMLKVLGRLPKSGENAAADERQSSGSEKARFYIATIGPTTQRYLNSEFGIDVDVCAEKPCPAGIGAGIQKFIEENKALD